MKKLMSALLISTLLFGVCSCNKADKPSEPTTTTTESSTEPTESADFSKMVTNAQDVEVCYYLLHSSIPSKWDLLKIDDSYTSFDGKDGTIVMYCTETSPLDYSDEGASLNEDETETPIETGDTEEFTSYFFCIVDVTDNKAVKVTEAYFTDFDKEGLDAYPLDRILAIEGNTYIIIDEFTSIAECREFAWNYFNAETEEDRTNLYCDFRQAVDYKTYSHGRDINGEY